MITFSGKILSFDAGIAILSNTNTGYVTAFNILAP